MPRIDERNAMFSRITRTEGTKEYIDYYNAHPENKEFDDSLRAMSQTIANKTRFFDKLNSPIVDSTFEFLSDINVFMDGEVKTTPKVESSPKIFTKRIKGLAELYGAKLTGVAELDKSYYYTYRGRADKVYGEKVEPNLPYTLF